MRYSKWLSALCAAGLLCLQTGLAQAAPQSGWWWNPNQSGRGFSIEIQGNALFMAGYLYENDGRASWLISGGAMQSATTYQGRLLAFSNGQTLTGAYQAPAAPTDAGAISLQFTDDTHGTLTWPGGSIPIERFRFSSAAAASFQPQTGWWWNPDESGRGFFIEVQGDKMFMAGYMYDANGKPVWYVSGDAMTSSNTYQSQWNQFANGQTLTGHYQPPDSPVKVGTVTLAFTGTDQARLTLPDGKQVSLTRFSFGVSSPTNLLANPGFEGSNTWVFSPNTLTNNAQQARTGSQYVWLGGYDNANDFIYQDVSIPSSAQQAYVQFWYRIGTSETSTTAAYDMMTVRVLSLANVPLATLVTLSNLNATTGWVQSQKYDVSAYRGQAIRLNFAALTDASNVTSFLVDDISLVRSMASTSPLVITAVALPMARAGTYYSMLAATATGGSPPYHFQSDTFANGTPPPGMIVTLDGMLQGTPSSSTTTQTYTFGICVADIVAISKCTQTSITVNQSTPTGSMGWTIGNQCNNGSQIDYKFYDSTNRWTWPSSTSHYYNTFGQTISHTLTCFAGSQVCIGGQSGSLSWGVGFSGNSSCSTCCGVCDGRTYAYTFGCSSTPGTFHYANWSCGSSSQCAVVMGGSVGTKGPFCSLANCQAWGNQYIPSGYACSTQPTYTPSPGGSQCY